LSKSGVSMLQNTSKFANTFQMLLQSLQSTFQMPLLMKVIIKFGRFSAKRWHVIFAHMHQKTLLTLVAP